MPPGRVDHCAVSFALAGTSRPLTPLRSRIRTWETKRPAERFVQDSRHGGLFSQGENVRRWRTTVESHVSLLLQNICKLEFDHDRVDLVRIEPTSKLTDPHSLSSLVPYALSDSLRDRNRCK